ncbi:MAG TPA: ribonuclease D [Bryobacteraceae bacterium]|nr:ribonuclease D [Bryobacteraceae bacterium]
MATQSNYITSPAALGEFCKQLKDSSRLALDTEFVGEDSFVPKLELIQVATETTAAVIDFPAVLAAGSLDAFWEIVCNPAIQKVVHAGRQDLDLFAVHAGQIPKPFFDTQIAAAMVGFGPQVAYANLVHRVHGTKLDKAHTFTNWSARPLSQDQLAYALEDVTFLLAIHDHLHGRLSKLGRLHWVDEEFSRLEGAVGETRREPQERYQRVRGWDTLKPKSAAVLRELAAWREGEAKRRNVPRGRVMRDEVLLQLARHPPRHMQELRAVRGLHGSEADRNGEAILAAIQAALSLPASAWPEVPKERKPEAESAGLVELLQAVMKARATEEEIAPTLLATTADLQALVDAKTNRAALDLPLLKGWRRVLLGDMLLDILDGKLAISIDPKSGTITWNPPSP